jgi:hypothetical protein
MLSLTLLILALGAVSALVGAITGLLAAGWCLFHHRQADSARSTEPADPFISAEIDRAAAQWATDQGRPEAASVMADKLHLLYALNRRRGQP